MDNEDNNPVNIVQSAIEEAALDFDPAGDSDSPRDAWWLRWLKFVSVIVIPAVILGLGFLFENYIEQYRAETFESRYIARRSVENESIGTMKYRFWTGACIGGGLGLIYVARCVIRKTDP